MADKKELAAGKKSSILPLILIVVITSAISIGIGMGQVYVMKAMSAPKSAVEKKPVKKEKQKKGAPKLATLVIHRMPPIIANLKRPSNVWVRVDVSVRFDKTRLKKPESVLAKSGQDILAFLQTLSLPEIHGGIGLANLKEDLLDRVRTRTKGAVDELFITALVVQ